MSYLALAAYIPCLCNRPYAYLHRRPAATASTTCAACIIAHARRPHPRFVSADRAAGQTPVI